MLATLGLLLITNGTPQLDQPNITTLEATPRHDFDRDVLKPLRASQEAKAVAEAKVAAAAAEAAAEELRRQQAAAAADLAASASMAPTGSFGNGYAFHQCTWYVASRIAVPAVLGNANMWDSNLLANGWRSGPPRRGAIAQTDAGYYGHVAIVEDVAGGLVHVSEYNYLPFAYSDRWAPANEFNYFY